ncbi:TetR/AcrR family transcriptional regulator [Paraburkholderia caffeinilytica]|uniref:TetR/AcrR family transcriptional regulator n=1 Tax=Paraburkholderia caffeinilytica TaxID=1761016 RepID=UPI003DA0F8F2
MKDLKISSKELGAKEPDAAPKRRGNRATRIPEILETAIRVFAAQGNAGFTQRRVAADAGIRLATLQHYFGSREVLLHSTIQELAKRYLERYRALATDKDTAPEARLEAILDETFAALTDPDNVVSSFALECWCLAEHMQSVSELMVHVSGEFQDIFSELVAQINTELPREECRLRGALIYSHWQGLIVFLRRAKQNAPEPAAFRTATKVVWKALSKAPH